MALFSKNKMAALSPTTPPKGFMSKAKKPNKNLKDKPAKGISNFMNNFGKK